MEFHCSKNCTEGKFNNFKMTTPKKLEKSYCNSSLCLLQKGILIFLIDDHIEQKIKG